jgi:PKD repeat protein
MKKILAVLMILCLISIAAACSSSKSPALLNDSDYPRATTTTALVNQKLPSTELYPAPGRTYTSAAAGYGSDGSTSSSGMLTPSSDRMVVRTGNISLVVSDIGKTIDSITKISGDFGGYVVTSQKWKDNDRNYGNISIRVLAENYDQAIIALRNMSLDVISETTSSQDVTEEYSDLGASLKNLEATEAQLLKIMETATKTEDILSIQRELTNVRGQIEQIKGRMQYLERTSTTSLINVNLSEAILTLKFSADKVRADIDENILFTAEINGGFEPYNYQWDFGDGNTSIDKSPTHAYKDAGVYSVSLKVTDDKGYFNSSLRSEYITVIGTWNPVSVAKSAWNGFAAFGRGLINVLIWLGIFSPIWIIVGGIIWLIVWRNRKKRA